MTTQPLTPPASDVADFVVQVRAELADLGPETVDELTVGLEADLADARAESPATWRDGAGSPAAYAAELRWAAGLPPRQPAPEADRPDPLRQWWDGVTANPLVGRARSEAHALAPAWWVIRGILGGFVIGYWILGLAVLDAVTFGLYLLGGAVSVWLARKALDQTSWGGWRALSGIGTALALLVVLVTGSQLGYRGPSASAEGPNVPYELMNQGETVQNLYAYGPDGRRLEDVRIYDQAGNQLETVGYPDMATMRTFPYSVDGADPWSPSHDLGWWAPPMSLVPLPGAESSEEQGESSSSGASPMSGTATKKARATPSPRSTTTD